MLAERDNKIAEFDVQLRKKDERCAIMETELRQRVQGEQLNCFLSFRPSMLIFILSFTNRIDNSRR